MYIVNIPENFWQYENEDSFFEDVKKWIKIGATLYQIQSTYSRLFLGKEGYDINKVISFWDKLNDNIQTPREIQSNIKDQTTDLIG